MKNRFFRQRMSPEPPDPEDDIRPVVILASPKPDVPDKIMQDELSGPAETADLWVLFTVHEDGITDVMLLSSTGSPILDQYGLDAAKQWRFRAARKNGTPVTSYLRLHIEFSLE